MDDIDRQMEDVRKYKQTTSRDGGIHKYKWTDSQKDETTTATNAIGEFH